MRSILAAGRVHPSPATGEALVLEFPTVSTRSLADYAIPGTSGAGSERRHIVTARPAPELPADLAAGLRRLKLAASPPTSHHLGGSRAGMDVDVG